MQIKYHKQFKKNYKKRIQTNPKLVTRFKSRLTLKLKNPTNPILKDHQLVGKLRQYRAFSITGNIRIVYKIENKALRLYNIGTHNQVY